MKKIDFYKQILDLYDKCNSDNRRKQLMLFMEGVLVEKELIIPKEYFKDSIMVETFTYNWCLKRIPVKRIETSWEYILRKFKEFVNNN